MSRFLIPLLCAAFSLSPAQAAAPAPGMYITEGGHGALEVKRSGAHSAFALNSLSANLNMCNAEGKIQADGRAQLEGDDKPCVIHFKPVAGAVQVESTESCRTYCGHNAYLDGTYLAAPALCTAKEISRLRKEFKKLYDQKQYPAAVAKLSPATQCDKFLMLEDKAWLRNDLALGQLRAGSAADCRQTLAPLQEFAAKSNEQLQNEWPPMRIDAVLQVAKATRVNLKLCQK
ncbi:hypothetical protein V8J88_21540 [Massilia sp. W12]|uniref:hypothetical protein n=1 Tax=Massilia sp. W12 TaxID=3126507 RepID=UPI0030D56192